MEFPTSFTFADGVALDVAKMSGPYIMTMDTRTMQVADFAAMPVEAPLTMIRAAAINTMDNYVASYADGIMQLLQASKECAQKKRSGQPVLDENGTVNLLNRTQGRLEQAIARVVAWDGKGEITALFPYHILPLRKKLSGDGEMIDTDNSKPFVNGLLFVIKGT